MTGARLLVLCAAGYTAMGETITLDREMGYRVLLSVGNAGLPAQTCSLASTISWGVVMTSRGVVMTSRGVVMTSRGVVMTSRGVVMTSRSKGEM